METFTLSRKELHRPGLLKAACAGRITSRQVAEALHLSLRQVRRLRRRFEGGGAHEVYQFVAILALAMHLGTMAL
jgi:hypothetical protein